MGGIEERTVITFFFFFFKNHISATLEVCRHTAFFLPKSDPGGLTRREAEAAPQPSLAVSFPGEGWKQAIKLCPQNNLTRDLKSHCCSFAGWKMQKSCQVWTFLWDIRNVAQVVQTSRRPNSSQSIFPGISAPHLLGDRRWVVKPSGQKSSALVLAVVHWPQESKALVSSLLSSKVPPLEHGPSLLGGR